VANYNANINITVAGASRLNAVTASVERLNNLSQNLKPLNLLAPGGGKLGDSIRLAIKPINDFARSVQNGNKRISNTFAGAVQQANVFRTVLENVKVAAGGYEKQSASVKLYANALAEAEKQATRLSAAQNDLARTAKGLQTQSQRDFEYYRRLNTIQSGRFKQRQQEARATEAINEAERIAASVRERETARTTAQQARGKRIRGAISEGIIGGSFPLLFGQGPGAAAGGAIGGIAGGLLGPGGGFAGSLLGTLLGGIAEQGNKIKELAGDIGFTAQQTLQLQAAFKLAGADADKFTEAVQNIRGVGLAIEDQAKAIQLVSVLTEKFGGNITKTTNALTGALESGKVTQATLNQLQNQGIDIQSALAEKYKTNRNSILLMAKDGKISVQDLINTLVDLGNKGTESTTKNKTAVETLTDAWNNLARAIGSIASTIVVKLTPPFDWLVKRLADITNIAANAVAQIGSLIDRAAFGPRAQAVKAVQQGQLPFGTQGVVELIGQKRTRELQKQAGPGMLGFGFNTDKFVKLLQQQPEFRVKSQALPPLKPFAAPSQLPPSAGKASKPKKDRAAEEAQRLQAVLKQLREEISIRDRVLQIEENIIRARADQDDVALAELASDQRILEIGIRRAKVQKDFDAGRIQQAEFMLRMQLIEFDQTEEQLKTEEALNKIYRERFGIVDSVARAARQAREAAFGNTPGAAGGAGAFRTDIDLMPGLTGGVTGEQIGLLKTELEELVKVENQVIQAAKSIGDAFGTSLKGVITGTITAQEALANFFQSVADHFADMAAQMISKWLQMQILGLAQSLLPGGSTIFPRGVDNFSSFFSAGGPSFSAGAFGGARAAGGPVASGSTYMVGERGPELFVPRSSGTIVPNHALSGTTNVVVNVDASGSTVQGDSPNANQLGRVISAAVQAELVKQQRPGGLLAGTR